jgi:hypothetical protein
VLAVASITTLDEVKELASIETAVLLLESLKGRRKLLASLKWGTNDDDMNKLQGVRNGKIHFGLK